MNMQPHHNTSEALYSTERSQPSFLQSKSIKEWREDERPRERLLLKGADSLSDAELLAILIRHGTKGYSALDIAKKLLDTFTSLQGIATRDLSELCQIHGLGEAKAVTLRAAFEMGIRLETEPFTKRTIIRSPKDAAAYCIPRMRGARTEFFQALLLNTANQVIRASVISRGSLNASIVHPREVFRLAIIESAASIIVVHNHPSGNSEPSQEDIAVTKQLVDAGNVLGIPVHDHIIIAGEGYTSLAELHLL